MLLKYFYDSALAHASYLVGCQRTGEALVVDPGRDVSPYLDTAAREGMRITGVAETHIHADFVSGARELAEQVGATLYLSDEGPPAWKYAFADEYESRLLHDGDHFMVGNVRLEVMHTPGHTPESISFVLTDLGGGATVPMGIFTGDFVFVGAVGRPDLLEKAAGVANNAVEGARAMFASLQRFKALPDHLQVWPAHGAGSACGKGLGSIPSSTVGYERAINPALQFEDEAEFVRYLLAGQPEVPLYFKEMKQMNREGPAVLAGQPAPARLDVVALQTRLARGEQVLDTRPSAAFAAGHVAGAINIPLSSLAQWAGWLIDYDAPLTLIAEEGTEAEALRLLHKIGVDQVEGIIDPAAVEAAGLNTERYEAAPPQAVAQAILNGEATLIDVRSDEEWEAGHLPNAHHRFLGTLPRQAAEMANGKPIVVQCRSGARSAIAASILQAAGAAQVINLAGGYVAWAAAGLPIERGTGAAGAGNQR